MIVRKLSEGLDAIQSTGAASAPATEPQQLNHRIGANILTLESLLLTSMANEAEWATSWCKFLLRAMSDGLGSPVKLGKLGLEIPPKFRYMLNGCDGGASESHGVKTEAASPGKGQAGQGSRVQTQRTLVTYLVGVSVLGLGLFGDVPSWCGGNL